jgi:hypothetical protein
MVGPYGPGRLAPLPPIRCPQSPLFFGLSGELGGRLPSGIRFWRRTGENVQTEQSDARNGQGKPSHLTSHDTPPRDAVWFSGATQRYRDAQAEKTFAAASFDHLICAQQQRRRMVRPRALAVSRLMTGSSLVSCSTGPRTPRTHHWSGSMPFARITAIPSGPERNCSRAFAGAESLAFGSRPVEKTNVL